MPNGSGRRRGPLAVAALVLASCGLALGLGVGSVGATGTRAESSTLDVMYTSAKSLQVKLSDGTVIGPGSPLPAGSYSVLVYDDPGTDPTPKFTLNGPGVSVSSDLNSTGMGIDQPATLGPYTFQAGGSYTVADTNMGPSASITFSTTTSGGAGGGPTTTTTAGGTGGGQQTTVATTTTSSSGSKGSSTTAKVLARLVGSVSASGKPTLTLAGKALKTLKAGLYKISVADHSKHAGLILGSVAPMRATTLSGVAAVGSSTHTVTLSVGRSFFEASMQGPKTYFTVAK